MENSSLETGTELVGLRMGGVGETIPKIFRRSKIRKEWTVKTSGYFTNSQGQIRNRTDRNLISKLSHSQHIQGVHAIQ